MSKLKASHLLIALEIALGATISILIAEAAGLQFAASAGITTLLTIQHTRNLTLSTSVQRYVVFLMMLALSRLVMAPLQFSTLSFGLFLLALAALCYLLGLQAVMPSNAVLASHFLVERHMALPLIVNEFWILTIGAAVGIAVNLLIPHHRQPLSRYRDLVEGSLRDILLVMSRRSQGLCEVAGRQQPCTQEALTQENERMRQLFSALDGQLTDYERAAREEDANRLQGHGAYPIAYFQMRSRQAAYLQRMWDRVARQQRSYRVTRPVADLLRDISERFAESNNAQALLEQLQRLEKDYDASPLPVNREEFEHRALVYALLQDLRSFLTIKRDFMASLSEKDIRTYWS